MIKQNTQEWLELRKTKIGASDWPVILGLVRQKKPIDLYFEKIGEAEPRVNEMMQHGRDHEEEAREKLKELTGITFTPEVVFHPEYDFLMASLDGVDYSGKRICEIKCPYYKASFEKRTQERKPTNIDYAQMQAQMYVKNLNNVFYFVYWKDPNGSHLNDYFLSECRRDQNFIDMNLPKICAFYDCMVNRTPPEDKYISLDTIDAESAKNKILRGKSMIEEGERLRAEGKIELLELSDFKSCIVGNVRIEERMVKGKVDYKKIPELEGVNLDSYRGPSRTSYFLFVDKDEDAETTV